MSVAELTAQLFQAITENDMGKVILLAHAGADVLAKDEQGRDTDDVASLLPKGPMREVLWLLSIGTTPLFCATCYNLTETAKELVAKGATDDAKIVFGSTSAHHAVRYGNLELIDAVAAGKSSLDVESGNGYTPLSLAVWFDELPDEKRLPIVKCLLANGANPNAKGRKGFTALHHAAWRDNKEIIEALLEAKADVNALTEAGDTPLAIADRFKSATAVKVLASAGGKKNVPKPAEPEKKEEEKPKEKTEESAIYDVLNQVKKA